MRPEILLQQFFRKYLRPRSRLLNEFPWLEKC